MPPSPRIVTGPFDVVRRAGVDVTPDTDPGAGHDYRGDLGRIIVPAQARLPELDGDASTADRFDADTMSGELEAYPSIIGRSYRMGWMTYHHLEPGCFAASIEAQDGRIPIYVQHNWNWTERPPIGNSTALAEVDLDDGEGDDARALQLSGRLYPDVPDGLACLHAMAARALREWSIGYLIEAYRVEEDADEGRITVYVERAELWEASVVLRGANPWTQTLDVASRSQPQTPDGLAALIAGEVARQLTPNTTDPMPPASDDTPAGTDVARIDPDRLADPAVRRAMAELTAR